MWIDCGEVCRGERLSLMLWAQEQELASPPEKRQQVILAVIVWDPSICRPTLVLLSQGVIALDEAQYDYLLALIVGERGTALNLPGGPQGGGAAPAAVAAGPSGVSVPEPSVLNPLIAQVWNGPS